MMKEHQSMTKKKQFITIAGNIGAGKSSLTKLLASHFGWVPYFESVDDNPYLSDFYADMKRWSFHLQVYFLSHRFRHHTEIMQAKESVIQDRSIYEDVEIFAHNLHDIGKMDDRDYSNYCMLFQQMSSFLAPPHLMVYLRANIETLVKQISRRGRTYEQGIPREYLQQLNTLYENWIGNYKLSPLLVIESDDLDFVNHPKDFQVVIDKIEKKLVY
jgi:deoxyadenosine/deoxycytidine kinase